MGNYVNRTCHSCGIRKPQPEMYRETVYVESGRSRSGLSARTGIGLLLGDRKSANAVNRWMFNTGQRTYQRKKEVWVCGRCGTRGVKGIGYAIGQFIGYSMIFCFILLILTAVTSP